ncbi:MAG: sel1 repeat family protein [Myxococcales bacterium]|nr:sel1 repeat family protein [Myxococcales bacterium]
MWSRLLPLVAVAAVSMALPSAALAQGEARDLALAALRLEYGRDNIAVPADDLDRQFKEACQRGYNPACRRSTWLRDGKPDPDKILEVFQPSCESGDRVACLVMGWALDEIAQNTSNPDERDRTWRRAARQLKADCDAGFAPACNDFATYLYENKGIVSDPRPAIARWKTACDNGEAASCTKLARLSFQGGPGVQVSLTSARTYASKACNMGYPDGCAVLGEIEGKGWSADKMDEYWGRLCDQGHRDSCWLLARTYYDGIYPEPTDGRIRGLFRQACALSHPRACYEAGRWELEHQGSEAEASQFFAQACDLDDAAGCSEEVDMILSGKVQRNLKEARDAFEVACEQRQSTSACKTLAFGLLDGIDIPRDAERGREILTRVCVDTDSPADACLRLGQCYEEGVGGERDRTEASKYYRWACASGNAQSCDWRGDLLTSDVGVRRDDAEALAMFTTACDGGILPACYKAGEIVDSGTYVKQDLERAAELYEAGCSGGVVVSCTALGAVYEKSPEPNLALARAAYERALQSGGSTESRRRLARLLYNGYGGKKERGRAKQLCAEACRAGDELACRGPAAQ